MYSFRIKNLIFFTLFYRLFDLECFALEPQAIEIHRKEPISELRLANQASVHVRERNGEKQLFALIRGRFDQEDGTLTLKNRKLPSQKAFRIPIPIQSSEEAITFHVISPLGESHQETVILKFPEYSTFLEKIQKDKKPSKNLFSSFGLGITYNTYKTKLLDFSQIAITPKLSFNYKLSKRWDIGFNSFFTVFSFQKKDPDISFRALGINARIGYVFPQIKNPWRFSIMGGLYYTTSFGKTSTGEFGYKNLYGPQIFPVLSYSFDNQSQISTYFKFSPIQDQFSFVSSSSHEIAFGGNYIFPPSNLPFQIGISLDAAKLHLKSENETVDSNSLTLGGNIYF